jgi:ribosome-associated protein
MTLHLSDTVVIRNEDLHERFVRAIGPLGANPRHRRTAVELRYDVLNAPLPDEVKARLVRLGGRHFTRDGMLVVTGRSSSSQEQNRDDAYRRLVAIVLQATGPIKPRRPTRPRRAVRTRRLADKCRHTAVKRMRRPLDER